MKGVRCQPSNDPQDSAPLGEPYVWLHEFALHRLPTWIPNDGPGYFTFQAIVVLMDTLEGVLREPNEGEPRRKPASTESLAAWVETGQEMLERMVAAMIVEANKLPVAAEAIDRLAATALLGGAVVSMPFVQRLSEDVTSGRRLHELKRLGGKARARYYREVEHQRVRAEFARRRKAEPARKRSEILKEMEAQKGSQKLRQLQTICRGMS